MLYGDPTTRTDEVRVTPFHCGPFANESERTAFEHVRSRIESSPGGGDEQWMLLTNLTWAVTHQVQADEIDLIAIGPPGVRVIEVKHWSRRWVDEHPVDQEADLVTNKARKIGSTLRKSVPDLGRVDGVILLTRESPGVKELTGRVVRGVRFCTLKDWREAIDFDAAPVLRPPQVARLGRLLAPKSAVALDGSLRRFAGYVNLERRTPPTERFHRVYRGVHATRHDKVILHLYDLSARDEARAEIRAKREFQTLHRLQLHAWAPRVLDSWQPAPGYAGEMHFFTVTDPLAPSIEKRASDLEWDTAARVDFTRAALGALGELHSQTVDDAPILHRNLTPGTVLVRHDNRPIFTGFELSRIPAEQSVGSAGPPSGEWPGTTAPEVRAKGLHAADARSDRYALCASLRVLFEDRDDEPSRQALDLLASGMGDDPAQRSEPSEIDARLSALLGESLPAPPPPPARFWTEDQVVPFRGGHYRVVERLGAGGVGTTFKVVETDSSGEDRGTFVAKVAHDQDAGRRTTHAYRRARSHVGRHPALSAILEVAPQWLENQFTALMTWIEGAPLHDFLGVFPLLAEEQGEVSAEALALRWLRDMGDALDVLHRSGFVHGDVSPANMIVSGQDLVLTDYDFVTKLGEKRTAPGTFLYCAPSLPDGGPAQRCDDIYALAASFFHLLFDREPFRYDGVVVKERGLNWAGIDRTECAMLASFLERATHFDPAQRFQSVPDALPTLRARVTSDGLALDISGTQPPTTAPGGSGRSLGDAHERREERVEHLRSLLQSYPGSFWGNRETRGLDTPFAEQTYVETRLEKALYADLLDRRVRLVVLCGNAGDGKTALLQHLAGQLGIPKGTSSERILEGRTNDGLTVRMHLDGSASWGERSADDLLDEFLEPFQEGPPADDIARLLAINDGRLLEWIERHETPLTSALSDRLDAAPLNPSDADTNASDPHIRFISLNQRSLVGGVTPDGSRVETAFLQDLVDRLYGGDRAADIWAPCQTCSAQERCDVFTATQMFAPAEVLGQPPPVRQRARERLFAALQAVHLRGETHITVRELRAALVYVLFGLHDCSDYHSGPDRPRMPRPQSYADRAFSPESPGRQGEVLRELVRFDPALEAHPQIDRYLLRSPSSDHPPHAPRHHPLPLAAARRRAYFEWSKQDIERLVPGDPDALDLARGRHLRQFRDLAVTTVATRDHLTECLCRGISRLEALPPLALDRPGVVPLRIPPRTPTETQFWVEKPLRTVTKITLLSVGFSDILAA